MSTPCFNGDELRRIGLERADVEEAIHFVNEQMKSAKTNQRQAKLQILATHTLLGYIRQHPDDPHGALLSAIVRDKREVFNNLSLDDIAQAYRNRYQSRLVDIMDEFAPRDIREVIAHPYDYIVKGTYAEASREYQDELVRAIKGESTDPKWQMFAKKWKSVTDELFSLYRHYGGDISYLKDWDLPQVTDSFLVNKYGAKEFAKDAEELFDWERMGVAPEDRSDFIHSVYDTFSTNGLSKLKPGEFRAGSKMANRHKQHRSIFFKNADSWLKYNRKYTMMSPYSSMFDYVAKLSREVALVSKFGPNPRVTFNTARDTILKESEKELIKSSVPKRLDASRKLKLAESSFDYLEGKLSPASQTLADSFQVLRNVISGLKLGGAALSSIPDTWTIAMAAKYNGLPAAQTMRHFLENLKNNTFGKAEGRRLAARALINLDFLLESTRSANRYADVAGQGMSARFVDYIIRGSGLNAWTIAGRATFQLEALSAMAEKGWTENTLLVNMLKRYDLTDEDIAKLSKAKKANFDVDGVQYRILDVTRLPRDLQIKVAGALSAESKLAINDPDAMSRAIVSAGTRRGTWSGELIRSTMMFKTFPITFMLNQWNRAVYGKGMSKGQYAMQLAIGLTLFGGLSVQLKEFSKGNDFVDPSKPSFWSEAFSQGGAGGIIMDLVSSSAHNRSLGDTLSGPLIGEIDKIFRQSFGRTLSAAADGDKSIADALQKSAGIAASEAVPSIWWSRLVTDRLFKDTLRRMSDPDFEKRQRAYERHRYEEIGTKRWWHTVEDIQ